MAGMKRIWKRAALDRNGDRRRVLPRHRRHYVRVHRDDRNGHRDLRRAGDRANDFRNDRDLRQNCFPMSAEERA